MLEKSAGAIIFYKRGNKIEYLLLRHEFGHWDFPKGNIEKNETLLDTVNREVEEETGIQEIFFIPKFKEHIKYFYRLGGKGRFKVVTFFLARSGFKKVKISEEHLGYRWATYEDAMKLFKFKNQKDLLKKANKHLLKNHA